jgi:hypothetical protein
MEANIERKLHDADAALVHSNDATTSGTDRSSQYFLFRETAESFSAEALNIFIFECPSVSEDRVRRESALPAA